jgi:hypothetical protein
VIKELLYLLNGFSVSANTKKQRITSVKGRQGGVVQPTHLWKGVVKMAIEDTFNGAKNGLALLQGFFNAVAQDIGMERAIALDAKVYKAMGAMQGKMMKEQASMEKFDAKAAASMALNSIRESFGIRSEVIEESPQRVMVRCHRCPVYEASQMVGLDTEVIETLCRASSIGFMDTMVKQLNPNLSYQLSKFRSGPDEFCEEEILLG